MSKIEIIVKICLKSNFDADYIKVTAWFSRTGSNMYTIPVKNVNTVFFSRYKDFLI